MTPGEVEVDGGVIERGMAEQHLDGAQVRPCFKHVSRVAVAQAMRGDVLFDPGSPAAFWQANQTILSLIGTSARQPSTTPGNRKIFGFIHRQ